MNDDAMKISNLCSFEFGICLGREEEDEESGVRLRVSKRRRRGDLSSDYVVSENIYLRTKNEAPSAFPKMSQFPQLKPFETNILTKCKMLHSRS